MIDGWDIVLQIVISILGGIIVAAYFYFFQKSKSEKLFEHHRNSNLKRIFSEIKTHDEDCLQPIYDKFENEFGSLERTRKELIKHIESEVDTGTEKSVITYFKKIEEDRGELVSYGENLDLYVEAMNRIQTSFANDMPMYSRYLHDSFLKNVLSYYGLSYYYVQSLLQNRVASNRLYDRMYLAKNIITYLKDEKTDWKKEESIKRFIDDWEATLKIFDIEDVNQIN